MKLGQRLEHDGSDGFVSVRFFVGLWIGGLVLALVSVLRTACLLVTLLALQPRQEGP